MGIYTISTYKSIDTQEQGYPIVRDIQFWGYCINLDDVISTLNSRGKYIYDYENPYCIVEYYDVGIATRSRERFFLQWDKNTQSYVLIDEPVEAACLTNFAMACHLLDEEEQVIQ